MHYNKTKVRTLYANGKYNKILMFRVSDRNIFQQHTKNPHTGHRWGIAIFSNLSAFYRLQNCACISAAARRPSPIARITVAPPRTMSPPA